MTEELQNTLASILETGKATLSTLVDTMMVEAPELIKELLWWNGITSFIWFIIFSILFLLLWKWEIKIWKWGIEKSDYDPYYFISIFYSMGHFTVALLAFTSLTWLKVLVAPRLFLLEWITVLVK
jgi:hypothetical protein